jgi:hypothetical protein
MMVDSVELPLKRGSMLKKKFFATALVAVALTIGGGATMANAAGGSMPRGCSLSPVAPTTSGAYLKYSATGSCTNARVESMVTRLVHNYDNLPDVRVTWTTDYYNPHSGGESNICDGGGTSEYYTQAVFYQAAAYGGDVWSDSSNKTLTHC